MKAIRFDKKQNNAFKKSLTVAIKGVCSNVGSTHLAIGIGNALTKGGIKVAVVEAAGDHCFQQIEAAYEGPGFVPKDSSFSIKYVTYFKSMTESAYGQVLHGDFDYIILDLGVNDSLDSVFMQADYKLLLGYGSLWHMEQYIKQVELYQGMPYGEGMTFCLQQVGKEEVKYLEKHIKRRVVQIPHFADPFRITEETLGIAQKIVFRK